MIGSLLQLYHNTNITLKSNVSDITFFRIVYLKYFNFSIDTITNKSHIVKEIYEYNYSISDWIKYTKTSDKLNNKIKFKCINPNINTEKINNQYIKTIIIYDDLRNFNIFKIFLFDNSLIFSSNLYLK